MPTKNKCRTHVTLNADDLKAWRTYIEKRRIPSMSAHVTMFIQLARTNPMLLQEVEGILTTGRMAPVAGPVRGPGRPAVEKKRNLVEGDVEESAAWWARQMRVITYSRPEIAKDDAEGYYDEWYQCYPGDTLPPVYWVCREIAPRSRGDLLRSAVLVLPYLMAHMAQKTHNAGGTFKEVWNATFHTVTSTDAMLPMVYEHMWQYMNCAIDMWQVAESYLPGYMRKRWQLNELDEIPENVQKELVHMFQWKLLVDMGEWLNERYGLTFFPEVK